MEWIKTGVGVVRGAASNRQWVKIGLVWLKLSYGLNFNVGKHIHDAVSMEMIDLLHIKIENKFSATL